MLTFCQMYCECRDGVGGAPLRIILPMSNLYNYLVIKIGLNRRFKLKNQAMQW